MKNLIEEKEYYAKKKKNHFSLFGWKLNQYSVMKQDVHHDTNCPIFKDLAASIVLYLLPPFSNSLPIYFGTYTKEKAIYGHLVSNKVSSSSIHFIRCTQPI